MVVASNFTMMKSQEFIFSSTPVLHGDVVVVAQVLTATAATNIRVVAVVPDVVADVAVVVVRNATLRRHEVTPLKRNPVVK